MLSSTSSESLPQKFAGRPAPDRLLVEVADYAASYDAGSALAYETAYHCLLDSLAIFKLVTFCEEQFAISIPDHEVLPDNMETVRAIAALVERQRGAG